MTQAACFAMGGVDVDRTTTTALLEVDTYSTVLAGFSDGHEWMGLLPETDPEMLGHIDAVKAVWDTYRPAIRQIVAQDHHSIVMAQILNNNLHATESSVTLAHHFLSRFGEEVFDPTLAGAVNLASHHRMLSQRAVKELCYIQFGLAGPDMRARLAATLKEYSDATEALLQGAAGVQPPPNSRIARNYRTAGLFWKRMQPLFDSAIDGKMAPQNELTSFLKLNASVLKQLNQAVGGYFLDVN